MRGWGMKKSFMERLAAFIVDKRRLFVVLFAVACVLSIFSASKTDVNNELTDYLPDSTQTRQGLEIMNREFITYGDAKVMVSNVTLAQAEELAEMLRGVDGVKDVEFEKDTHHYNSASALFEVTFDGEKLDEISIQGVKNVRAALSGYDTYITTEIGNPTGEILEHEMRIVLIILMCSIFVVLLLTSRTYAEVPVLIITFGVAVWVNKPRTTGPMRSRSSPTPSRRCCSSVSASTTRSSCATTTRRSASFSRPVRRPSVR